MKLKIPLSNQPRQHYKVSKTAGLPPGTLVHVGDKKTEHTIVDGYAYNEEKCERLENVDVNKLHQLNPSEVLWLNVIGLHETDKIAEIGKHFDFHSLLLEDIVNTQQRSKFEDYGNVIYVPLKMLSVSEESHTIVVEQVSLVLGHDMLISFQEAPGDVFDPLRERIEKGMGRVRTRKEDYLLYALSDVIVDNYFTVMEFLRDKATALENRLFNEDIDDAPKHIMHLKQQVARMRRHISPVRDALGRLIRDQPEMIKEENMVYFSDVYDHLLHISESLELIRENVSSLMDTHYSLVSNKMNEVMKVLTIIATIFIPLTFIAGIYGMNFDYMPELRWKYAYFTVWGVMILIFLGMMVYFKRKKWL